MCPAPDLQSADVARNAALGPPLLGGADPSQEVLCVTGRSPKDFTDYAADAAPAWRDY
ncbi:hypothetical protein GCM10027570_27110 [Streptomonospora sediminis]